MNQLPKVDSTWSSTNGVIFIVKELFDKDNETWIRYINRFSSIEYTCLLGAFLERFREQPK